MKKSENNNKITIKNSQKQEIFNDFLLWVDGIQEDEPVPFEVEFVYFVLDFTNNDIVLSYSGSSKKLEVFELALYSPLEGEYLFSNALKQLSKDVFEKKKNISKKQIFDMLKDIVFSATKKLKFLENKKILFGKKYNKVKY